MVKQVDPRTYFPSGELIGRSKRESRMRGRRELKKSTQKSRLKCVARVAASVLVDLCLRCIKDGPLLSKRAKPTHH